MKGKILLCVLDWGLGHATRSLALARELAIHGFDVEIASSGSAMTLLKEELPAASFHTLPGYNIQYPVNISFELAMIAQLGKINRAIREEKNEIDRIVSASRFIAIISDNRYGCYHPSVRSIFLSHHLRIGLSGLWRIFQAQVNRRHLKLISRFDACWVPDFEDRSLSGDLSRANISKLIFVGPLSTMAASVVKPPPKYELLAVLSGPEPQRTRFAGLLLKQLQRSRRSWLLVHGLPGRDDLTSEGQIAFMKRNELNRAIEESELIIARSGYSTVMDLATLGAKVVFVPTPGQTEQRYLADQLMDKGIAFCQEQADLDLDEAVDASDRYSGFHGGIHHTTSGLTEAIATLSQGK
jgi:hypothetical protein